MAAISFGEVPSNRRSENLWMGKPSDFSRCHTNYVWRAPREV